MTFSEGESEKTSAADLFPKGRGRCDRSISFSKGRGSYECSVPLSKERDLNTVLQGEL